MSENRTNILIKTYQRLRKDIPAFVWNSMRKLFPLLLINSILDIFGLVMIFPVVNILLDPSTVSSNKVLHYLYDEFHFTQTVPFVLFLIFSITIFFILKNVVIYFSAKRQTRIAFDIAAKLAYNNFNHHLSQPYEYFSENNTALMLRNFSQLPFEIVTFVVLPFALIVNEMILLLILVIIMLFFDPILFTSILIFAFPFVFLYNLIFRKKLREISERRNKEGANLFKSGMQSMEGFREMVVFNKLDYFKPLYKRSIDSYSRSTSSVYLLNLFSPKIVETVAVICITGIFISGFIFGKDIQALGQFLVVFSLAAYRVIPSMNKIILSGNYIKSSFFTLDYFKRDEGTNAEQKNRTAQESRSISFKKELSIQNVSFQYKSSEAPVLNDIQFKVNKGETIGIIGPSGSGKSTLLNILLRLFIEEKGGIFVDDVKIDEKNLNAWYELVSYVPQNITLIDGTIAENVAFGVDQQKLDRDLLNKAIERAQLSDLVKSLPLQTENLIGENGIKLSGGQRQRIGIARALYHGGQIMIFDEATSSLDAETERMVTESIHTISHQELTIIIVAHRMETLKYCDHIFKIEKGRLTIEK